MQSRLFYLYDRLLRQHPIITKAVTGGTLAFAGDLHAQIIEAWSESDSGSVKHVLSIDTRRSFAFTSLSTCWTGGGNHHWYGLLERYLPQGAGWRTVLPKVAANQLFMNPFLYMPTFFIWTGVILERSFEETIAKAQGEYWESLRGCWLILGGANVVMFTALPVRYHAVFMCAATFCFNVLLSLISNRDALEKRKSAASREKTIE